MQNAQNAQHAQNTQVVSYFSDEIKVKSFIDMCFDEYYSRVKQELSRSGINYSWHLSKMVRNAVLDYEGKGSTHCTKLIIKLIRTFEAACRNVFYNSYGQQYYYCFDPFEYDEDPIKLKHAKFIQKYSEFLDNNESNGTEFPYLLLPYYLSNPKALLETPYRSFTNPNSLAYHRNIDDVIRNRQTVTKPARYFVGNNFGKEHEAIDFSTEWITSAKPSHRPFKLSDLEGGARSEDNWQWLYANTDRATNSCMIKVPEAARVYAFDPRLDAVYFTEDNQPKGLVIARSIVRNDTKKYIRIYYTDYTIEKMLENTLVNMGYREERDMNGIKLGIIKKSEKEIWLPYVDGESQYVKQHEDHLEVVYGDGEDDDSEYQNTEWDYEAFNSEGYVRFATACKSCGKVHNEDYTRVRMIDGQPYTDEVCWNCVSFLSSIQYNNPDQDDYKTLYVDKEVLNSGIYKPTINYWGDLEFLDEIPSDYVKITCLHSIKRAKRFVGLYEGNEIYTKADQAVKTFDGSIAFSRWVSTPFGSGTIARFRDYLPESVTDRLHYFANLNRGDKELLLKEKLQGIYYSYTGQEYIFGCITAIKDAGYLSEEEFADFMQKFEGKVKEVDQLTKMDLGKVHGTASKLVRTFDNDSATLLYQLAA